MVKISIVIPALNEATCLPLLFNSIKQQTFTDYEVIVADAGSTDSTVDIAKEFGATVVVGGLPAVGRNNGAAVANGDYLFFLDADVIIPNDFLQKALQEIELKKLGLATCIIVPLSHLYIDKFLCSSANLFVKMFQRIDPHGPGFCLLSSKAVFQNIKGFNETLTLGEDHDYVKRAAKHGTFRVLNSTHIVMSVRRLEKEGRLGLLFKYLKVEWYRLLKGEMTTEVVEYEFGVFDNKDAHKKKNIIAILDEKIVTYDKKIYDFLHRKRLK